MDKRYQVFISSTYTDLRDERQAVLSALLELDAIPSGMEFFPASDEDAWSLIERVIAECDYYIIMVGGRYGSQDDSGLGFTEREYSLARSLDKPILGFLHGEPGALRKDHTELSEEGDAKLTAFRKRLETDLHVKYWTGGPDELAGKVSRSFAALLKRRPSVGWVRADELTPESALDELNRLRQEVVRLNAQIEASQAGPPIETQGLAQGQDEVQLKYALSVGCTAIVDGVHHLDSTRTIVVTLTTGRPWSEIFGYVGPKVFSPGSTQELREALNYFGFSLRDSAFEKAESLYGEDEFVKREYENRDSVNFELKGYSIQPASFDRVHAHMLALGLIQQATTVDGRPSEPAKWLLTEHGRRVLISALAIPKPSAVTAVPLLQGD